MGAGRVNITCEQCENYDGDIMICIFNCIREKIENETLEGQSEKLHRAWMKFLDDFAKEFHIYDLWSWIVKKIRKGE